MSDQPSGRLPTLCAPAERASQPDLVQQIGLWGSYALLKAVLNGCPIPIFVLNPERQIVLSNEAIVMIVDSTRHRRIYGMRPGELLDCIHADETTGGCGTAQACNECGALAAILGAQSGKATMKQCFVVRRSNGALDVTVSATPVSLGGQDFVVCALVPGGIPTPLPCSTTV